MALYKTLQLDSGGLIVLAPPTFKLSNYMSWMVRGGIGGGYVQVTYDLRQDAGSLHAAWPPKTMIWPSRYEAAGEERGNLSGARCTHALTATLYSSTELVGCTAIITSVLRLVSMSCFWGCSLSAIPD